MSLDVAADAHNGQEQQPRLQCCPLSLTSATPQPVARWEGRPGMPPARELVPVVPVMGATVAVPAGPWEGEEGEEALDPGMPVTAKALGE